MGLLMNLYIFLRFFTFQVLSPWHSENWRTLWCRSRWMWASTWASWTRVNSKCTRKHSRTFSHTRTSVRAWRSPITAMAHCRICCRATTNGSGENGKLPIMSCCFPGNDMLRNKIGTKMMDTFTALLSDLNSSSLLFPFWFKKIPIFW